LDLSNNKALYELWCSDNKTLKSLNLKNGNNRNMEYPNLENNHYLRVQVDDVEYSKKEWSPHRIHIPSTVVWTN